MNAIRSLRPNVTREEAIRKFCASGLQGFFRGLYAGPLRAVADVYVPFRVFRVEITNRGKTDGRLFGVDAVNGSLDLYSFDEREPETTAVHTRNRLDMQLDEDSGRELLAEKLRRVLFQQGFFRMRDLEIKVAPVIADLYVPYWVGFTGRNERVKVSVIDALRRSFEGAKVRMMISAWLAT